MSKAKAAAPSTPSSQAGKSSGNDAPVSMIPDTASESVESSPAATSKRPITNIAIRILYQGTCPKLTTRGAGQLTYELGIDDATGNTYIRIAANASSGAFSHEWIGIGHIRTMLETEKRHAFPASVMHPLFVKRSSNNQGYLSAILKAEGVLKAIPGQASILSLNSWDSLIQKIDSLKKQKVSLTDHIAIAAKIKAEKKAQLMTKVRSAKPGKSSGKSKSPDPTPDQEDDVEDSQED